MSPLIELTTLWRDRDVLKIRIFGTNASFSGSADAYLPVGGLAEAAELLRGFPKSITDERELVLGSFGPAFAGGAAKLNFHCSGLAGHSFIECWFESDGNNVETAHFHARVEPSAVDDFVSELKRMEVEELRTARLLLAVL